MPMLQMVILVPASILAAFLDIRYRRVPNVLVLAIAITGVSAAWFDGGLRGVLNGGLSALLAMGICIPLYVTKGIAGGDVKLIVATGFWWTVAQLWIVLAATAICGALLGIGWLSFSRDATHVPYAVAIASGTVGTVFLS